MMIPIDGMIITQDTVFDPGVYYLPNGITIAADGVTLHGNGALPTGANRTGHGIVVRGRQGVTIKKLRLREYHHGIHASHCNGLTIASCQVTATAEMPANAIFWIPGCRPNRHMAAAS